MVSEKKAKKTHRAMELLEVLHRLGGSARTSHLAATMNVSEETVRRTIKKLSKDGSVTRVHGGVFLAGDAHGSEFHRRISEHSQEKQKMAELAASLIKNGSTLFLDVGTTTAYVADALRVREHLLVVTNSITIAQTLMGHNGNRVFLTGGEVSADCCGILDASARDFISRFDLDTAVLSADALDASKGFLLENYAEATLTQSIVHRARTTIMVVDQSKSGRHAPMLVCDPVDIDILVTDRAPAPGLAAAIDGWGISTMIAEPDARIMQ